MTKNNPSNLIKYNQLFADYLRKKIEELEGDRSGMDWGTLIIGDDMDVPAPVETGFSDTQPVSAEPEEALSWSELQRQKMRELYSDDTEDASNGTGYVTAPVEQDSSDED